MDEEIVAIDANTRNEKIKNFFINNKKNFIVGFSIILILIIGYLSIKEIKAQNKIKLANKFNITKINFGLEDRQKTINQLIDLICLLYTSPSPRDGLLSRMPSSA